MRAWLRTVPEEDSASLHQQVVEPRLKEVKLDRPRPVRGLSDQWVSKHREKVPTNLHHLKGLALAVANQGEMEQLVHKKRGRERKAPRLQALPSRPW